MAQRMAEVYDRGPYLDPAAALIVEVDERAMSFELRQVPVTRAVLARLARLDRSG